jgi:hypothetical protein
MKDEKNDLWHCFILHHSSLILLLLLSLIGFIEQFRDRLIRRALPQKSAENVFL